MTVFLTPDGEPFYGGTYFPPEPRHGLPGFRAGAGRDRRGVARPARRGRRARRRSSSRRSRRSAQLDARRRAAAPTRCSTEAVRGLARSVRAGLRRLRPRAEVPAALDARVPAPARRRATRRRWSTQTLDAMARGGMYDQLGGGFHRYSVDDRWLVPHFEKMLYDNAQLAATTCTRGS